VTREEVVRELIDGPSRAYVPFPELEVIERPDFARLTCSLFPTGGFNGVSRTRVSAAEVDALIDETLADYRRRGLRFRWSVMPDSTPSDLAQRLAARGLVASEVVAMSLPLSAGHGSAMAREVTEPETFTRVMAEGWGAPAAALLHVNRAALADPSRRQRLFVAHVRGAPAGGAGMMIGYALIDPGDLTRGQALKKAGQRATKIVIGCAVILFGTGIIEGFLSPSGVSPAIKYGTGILTGLLFVAYVMLIGREEALPEPA